MLHLTDASENVIALSQQPRIPIDDIGYKISMTLTTYSSSSNAIKNYSGSSNTTAMISAYGNDKAEAAGYCANFTFPNGKKGYLGSAGEWQAAYDNKSAIATCMSKAGGTALGSNYYWSSTRATNDYFESPDYGDISYNRFWHLFWSDGGWDDLNYANNANFSARPFSAL